MTSDEKITNHEVGWSPLRTHPINVRGGRVSDWEESQMLAALKYKALVVSEFSAALQTAHDIWENWAAGASHAGGSFSLGL